MALADFAALRSATAAPTAVVASRTATPTGGTVDSMFYSRWAQAGTPSPGTAPTTAVAPVSTDTGALPIPGSSGRLVLTGAAVTQTRVATTPQSAQYPGGILIDRLSHQGGLNGTVLGPSVVNLPTAALTRNTDGVGVMIGVQIYSALGATDSVLTMSYTNTADVSGRTATIRFTADHVAGSFYWAALEGGDLGVKSVESVSLSIDTGAAGNFGIVLFKPLAVVGFTAGWVDATLIAGWNSQIPNNAHLDVLYLRNAQTGDVGVVLQMSEV